MLNRIVVPILGVLMMLSSPALASTWYVNGVSGDDGNNCKTKLTACATIGHAITLAASRDTIQIAAATYQENLSIPFNLTLNGAKAATTIVDGTSTTNVFTVGVGISLTLSNLTIKNGVGYSGGGGVDNAGTLTVNKSNFYTNTALSGGAIFNTGTATISNSNLSGNSPYFFGHSASCGAIDNRSTMTITNSTFYSNYANNNYTSGGAICNGGTLTITGTTFNTNSSQGNNGGSGGAIYAYAGTLSVTNSTFSQNSATTSGGAIYSQGGTVQISNSTFGINPATSGGGGGALSNAGGSVLIQNSIVANIGYGGNCAGTITSDGYNLSSDSTCNFSGPGDLNGKTPKLGALANNGGPTQTMALQKASPALDAGNPGGCRDFAGNLLTTDQRGKPRPDKEDTGGCDIGAYESQATTLTNCPSPTSVGAYTFCSEAHNDVSSTTTSTVALSPYAGNGVEVIAAYCANSGCNAVPSQTATIRDNINNPELCFTQSPHSPYSLSNASVPDYERVYVWYCPSIPAGVTSITVTTNVAASVLANDAIEWKAGSIAASNFFESVDQGVTSGAVASTTASVSTSATTINSNDLITALLYNCGAVIPATVGSGYTGIIVNPSDTPGHVFEAKGVVSTGVQTATITWSSGTAPSSCNLGAGGSNDTWQGVIVPLIGSNQAPAITSETTESSTVGTTFNY